MKRFISVKISYILVVFFLGALTMFLCSIFGAFHAVRTAAAQAEACPTVILDAGHGGEDGGAVGVNGVEEKTLNLQIALLVQEKLRSRGIPVLMVREDDTAIGDTGLPTIAERKRSDIRARTALVNSTENCVLVSIHQNFFSESQYSGAQVFYSGNDPESEVLAESIRESIVSTLQPENQRACKEAESGIYLLKNVYVPAVIVECGFISNPAEAALLSDPAYQERLAEAIATGTIAFCAPDIASISEPYDRHAEFYDASLQNVRSVIK